MHLNETLTSQAIGHSRPKAPQLFIKRDFLCDEWISTDYISSLPISNPSTGREFFPISLPRSAEATRSIKVFISQDRLFIPFYRLVTLIKVTLQLVEICHEQ